MAIIRDPDSLVRGTDVVIDTSARTIKINAGTNVTSAGSTGGVSGQALYSFLKEQWKSDNTLNRFRFPMESITNEQFEFLNGWAPADATTRSLIRDAGWVEKDASGVVLKTFMGVVSLGSIGATDVPYYSFNGGAPVNATFQGPLNQAVQIYEQGSYDYTNGTATFTVYVRVQGKTYTASTNTAIGASTLTYKVNRFPLSNASDTKVSASDATIASDAAYTGITYKTLAASHNIDGTAASYTKSITVTSSATPQQIYEKMQYLLRQSTDIDSDATATAIGQLTDQIVYFVGDTLYTSAGVFIDGLGDNYKNSVVFTGASGTTHTYPFFAAGTINFGSFAGSGDFKYRMYFTSTPAGSFDTAQAIVVNDASGNPIEGTYAGVPVDFTFAYDTNVQGGRTAGTNAAVTLVGIGLSGGQYTSVTGSITRTQGQSILIAPAQERNYLNP